MTIQSLDQALAGMQPPQFYVKGATGTMVAGQYRSLWKIAGTPSAGASDTTLNGVALSAPISGQIPFADPTSGNAYLARLSSNATIAGQLLLCDRLWHNGGYTITSTSAQSSTTPAWPARDADGATAGRGVFLALEVSAATGAGTPTITCSYTNSAGGGPRSATNVIPTTATSAVGAFYPIGVQDGDEGVRSLLSMTLSATWTSGTINMVAYRVLASVELSSANVPNAVDVLTSGMPRLYNDTVPFLVFIPSTTTTSYLLGQVLYTHG